MTWYLYQLQTMCRVKTIVTHYFTLLIAILYVSVVDYDQLLGAYHLCIASGSWVLVTYTDILSRYQ